MIVAKHSCSSFADSGSQEEEIVMLNDSFRLAVWRLPAAPAAAASAPAPASAAAAAAPEEAASSSAAGAASTSTAAASSLEAPDPYTQLKMLFPGLSEQEVLKSMHAMHNPRFKYRRRRRATDAHRKAMQKVAVTGESDAVLMAFTETRFRSYSVDRSPDGRFVAVGEQNFLSCFSACFS